MKKSPPELFSYPSEEQVIDTAEYRYKAFISYSHADEIVVSKLHQQLERYVIPAAVVQAHNLPSNRVRPIFRDRDELAATNNLSEALQDALRASEYLLVACSPKTANSHWVNEEINYFTQHRDPEKVLVVIVDGDAGAPTFPEGLRFARHADGSLNLAQPLEPMAADLREGADGPDAAALKLIAALVGVRYDELVQRDQQYRNRRLRRIATVSMLGMLCAGALAVFAFMQRNAAVEQRLIAERESATANRVVEFLTNTFRVADPATENPQEITAVNVLERGASRLKGELMDEPVVRARLMATVADVYLGLGLYKEAQEMLEGSLDTSRSEAQRSAERLADLAEIKLRRAQFDGVRELVAEANSILAPDDAGLVTAQLASVQGRMALAQGDVDAAVAHSQQALAIYLATDDLDPLVLALEQSYLARAFTARREFANALPLLDQAIQVHKAVQGETHSKTATLLLNRANVLLQQKDHGQAKQALQEVMPVLHAVYGETHPTLATAYVNQGVVALALNEPARDPLLRARDIGEAHFGKDHGFMVFVLFNLALAEARAGDGEAAYAVLDEVARVLGVIYAPDHPAVPFVTTQRGVVAGTLGDVELARQRCERGIEMLEALGSAGANFMVTAREECANWLPMVEAEAEAGGVS